MLAEAAFSEVGFSEATSPGGTRDEGIAGLVRQLSLEPSAPSLS